MTLTKAVRVTAAGAVSIDTRHAVCANRLGYYSNVMLNSISIN